MKKYNALIDDSADIEKVAHSIEQCGGIDVGVIQLIGIITFEGDDTVVEAVRALPEVWSVAEDNRCCM